MQGVRRELGSSFLTHVAQSGLGFKGAARPLPRAAGARTPRAARTSSRRGPPAPAAPRLPPARPPVRPCGPPYLAKQNSQWLPRSLTVST